MVDAFLGYILLFLSIIFLWISYNNTYLLTYFQCSFSSDKRMTIIVLFSLAFFVCKVTNISNRSKDIPQWLLSSVYFFYLFYIILLPFCSASQFVFYFGLSFYLVIYAFKPLLLSCNVYLVMAFIRP